MQTTCALICLLVHSLLSETVQLTKVVMIYIQKESDSMHLVQWMRQVGEWHFIRLLKAQLKAHGVCRHQISPAEPALPLAVIGRET